VDGGGDDGCHHAWQAITSIQGDINIFMHLPVCIVLYKSGLGADKRM